MIFIMFVGTVAGFLMINEMMSEAQSGSGYYVWIPGDLCVFFFRFKPSYKNIISCFLVQSLMLLFFILHTRYITVLFMSYNVSECNNTAKICSHLSLWHIHHNGPFTKQYWYFYWNKETSAFNVGMKNRSRVLIYFIETI